MKTIVLIILCLITLNTQAQRKKKPSTTTTTTTLTNDPLFKYCGMVPSDSGFTYPTTTLTNLKTYHRTAQIQNLDGTISLSDVSVIAFDPAVIPGKQVKGYILTANPCDGRVGCGYANDFKCAQVTSQTPYPQFDLLLGVTWLSTGDYTGQIHIETTDFCIYVSQTFPFTPPQYK